MSQEIGRGAVAPVDLDDLGRLRWLTDDPHASLGELGRLADPPLSKDAVAGRMNRLVAIADRAARELGIPDTASAIAPGRRRQP